jgi:hypothetical protein
VIAILNDVRDKPEVALNEDILGGFVALLKQVEVMVLLNGGKRAGEGA